MEAWIDRFQLRLNTEAEAQLSTFVVSVREAHGGAEMPAALQPLAAPSPWATIVSFVASDALALTVAGSLCLALPSSLIPAPLFHPSFFLSAAAVLGLAYALSGLYAGVAMHPAEEMRRIAIVTTIVFLVYGATLLLDRASWTIVFLVGVTWGLSVLLVTACRVSVRIFCGRASWWGYGVIVMGQGEAGVATIKTLKRWHELGFKPLALLDATLEARDVNGVPVCRTLTSAPMLALRDKIPYLIVAMPQLPHRKLMLLLGRYSKFFERVLIVPEHLGTQALWTNSKFFSGIPGYDVQHARQKPTVRFLKRGFDIAGALLGVVIMMPFWLIFIGLIKLDSPGPAFFRQTRFGLGGHGFKVLKFRTMYTDSQLRLQELLHRDPERREEYETFRKLRMDPRITRVGSVLRRYSLDELPQLWNVLRGEMSLVGPRAYMPEEICKMGGLERIIFQSRPGITGLWQVSGRNELTFEERVGLAIHYTNNWNLWLDLYILIRTIPAVLTGEGAS